MKVNLSVAPMVDYSVDLKVYHWEANPVGAMEFYLELSMVDDWVVEMDDHAVGELVDLMVVQKDITMGETKAEMWVGQLADRKERMMDLVWDDLLAAVMAYLTVIGWVEKTVDS